MASNGQGILIVGGGLIGTEAALTLAGAGRPVRVLSRSLGPRLLESAAASGIELIEAEISRPQALAETLAGVDAIICLAGSSTPAFADSDPENALLNSVHPALTTLETARRAGIPRVVLASSGGTIYGADAPTPTPESAPLRPSSLHGTNYLAVEGFADFYRREHGIEVVVLRFSNVYGPGAISKGGQGVIAAWVSALALGHPVVVIGSDQARRDFVYSSDAAAAVEAALTIPAGTYNVGGGKSTSLAELIIHLREISGEDFKVEMRPGRGVDIPSTFLDIGKMRSVSSWEPKVEIAAGLRKVWAWEVRDLPADPPDN